jgi:hypothetical protein
MAWKLFSGSGNEGTLSIVYVLEISLIHLLKKNFLPRLKSHLLGRILDFPYDGDEHEFLPDELASVVFIDNRLYQHKVNTVLFCHFFATFDFWCT